MSDRRLSDYDMDRLSIKAFHHKGRLCQRCQKRFTVAKAAVCPGCLEIEVNRVQSELARLAMPLFGDDA